MKKYEVCRLIAEKLNAAKFVTGCLCPECIERNHAYFTSEDASARLLDAMLAQWKIPREVYEIVWEFSTCNPRKAAIVLAAMKWLKIEGELEEV